MLLYANQYDVSFVSDEKLKEISIVLKNGRTIQSKVMDLIFIILGCIVLRIDDHCAYLQEFKNILSNRNLKNLRNDLENLMHFNTKFFNCLIMELVKQTFEKEYNYRDRCIRLYANGIVPGKQWNEVVIRRKVKAIVKFLIFRKARRYHCSRDENDTSDWSFYKENIGIILNNESSPMNAHNKIIFDRTHWKYSGVNYQRDTVDPVYQKMNENVQDRSEIRYKLCQVSKCLCSQQFYDRVHLFYGWLWLILYSISMLLCLTLLIFTCHRYLEDIKHPFVHNFQ